jgi:hypothetical protein
VESFTEISESPRFHQILIRIYFIRAKSLGRASLGCKNGEQGKGNQVSIGKHYPPTQELCEIATAMTFLSKGLCSLRLAKL